MLGVYDFCGHYEWTFDWLDREGGHALVLDYWDEAIHGESQQHAARLIREKGFDGMRDYWGHTLSEEAAGYAVSESDRIFRIDMHECPSKGFLIRNELQQYSDYCDHCMGWIGPMLKESGHQVNHQHNHQGRCWWEISKESDPASPSKPGTLAGESDVRLRADWDPNDPQMDTYSGANHPDQKD